MPVMMPAAAMLSSYMPNAASCESSRKGLPGSSSAWTRSRGRSLPRPRCLALAASPPPCSIVATFARRSATCASIDSRLAANAGARGFSFVSSVATLMTLERCEAGGKQHEQRADHPLQHAREPRAASGTPSRLCSEPRDRQVDEQTVDVEQRAERDEGERRLRGLRVDELRQEREEEQRDLRIEHVDDQRFAEDPSRTRHWRRLAIRGDNPAHVS